MIKPILKNILIQPHTDGFTAVQQVDEKSALIEKATVLAVGDEVTLVKEGDIIYFKDYETDTLLENNQKYVLINEEAIKALYFK